MPSRLPLLLLLLSSTLCTHAAASTLENPADKIVRVKELIQKIKSENPVSVGGSKARSKRKKKNPPKPYDALQEMRKRIQQVKNSIPSTRDEEETDEISDMEQVMPMHPLDNSSAFQEIRSVQKHENKSPTNNRDEAVQKALHHQSQWAARLAKIKRGVSEFQKDTSLHKNDSNVLKLSLTKPLGFILDGDNKEEAIVFDLDDEYPGAAQQLSKEVQEEILGRKIVKVNEENVSTLTLHDVAERIVASASPILLEFEIVAATQNVLRLTLDKPLGIILDNLNNDQAIVYSLDNEYPGAVQKLSLQFQAELVGRRIVSINDKDVTDLSLMEVAEQIVASPSPITLEFEIVKEENQEKDGRYGPKIDYYDTLLPESVQPGQLSLLKWNDNQDVIDPFASQIGLPKTLVPTIQAYAKRLEIIEGIKDILYNNPCDPQDGRFYETANPHLPNKGDLPFLRRDKLQWYAQRPGSHWNSDMHWFAGSDEYTHESMLHMLFEGGIDQVLNAIGTHFNLDGLFIQSVGFLGVTHCEEGYLHNDFDNVDGKFFNLLIPVTSPEGAELNVAGERISNTTNATAIVGAKINYDPQFGVLVGDKTLHGTRECDHRPQGDIRVVLSIYLADITDDNVHKVSSDDTAIFPVPEVEEWLWAQQGRHWSKDMCMLPDKGRWPLWAEDRAERCAEVAKYGKCDSSPKLARKICPQSCNVYMEDYEYQPGLERNAVMGDFDFVV